jgi:hypothetical protein
MLVASSYPAGASRLYEHHINQTQRPKRQGTILAINKATHERSLNLSKDPLEQLAPIHDPLNGFLIGL